MAGVNFSRYPRRLRKIELSPEKMIDATFDAESARSKQMAETLVWTRYERYCHMVLAMKRTNNK